jgi:DNA-binding HxlR family transcriptional regulator
VAALAAGQALPDVDARRLQRALDGLERDGLIERSEGCIRLPGDALR